MAASLKKAGADVRIIPHSEVDAERLRADGIVISKEGTLEMPVSIMASSDPADAAASALILTCVKSYDTSSAIQSLLPHLHEGTPLILIQNGAGACDEVAAIYPRKNVYCGIVSYGALMQPDRSVKVFGAPALQIVPAPGSSAGPLKELSDLLPGISITQRSDAESVIWSKLCMNCGINPVTALFSLRNGELRENPEAWQFALNATREACAVAHAAQIPLLFRDCAKELTMICERTAGNRSSMLQDVNAGRPTEINYINGYAVRKATELGIATPVNRDLIDRILQLDHRA